MTHTINTVNKQDGAALIFSLIILLVLTLLGITSMNNATLEEKMAYNMRDLNLSFEAAEAALREAEVWLQQQNNEDLISARGFVYQQGELPDLSNQDHDWWTNNNNTGSYGIAGSDALSEVSTQPRFVIESGFVEDNVELNNEERIYYYRITARGTGATDTAQTITQNVYARRFN